MARVTKINKKSNKHFLWLILLSLGVIILFSLFARKETSHFPGTAKLNSSDYIEHSRTLTGNNYQVSGSITERLDKWNTNKGRLYNITTDNEIPIPILIPASLSNINIERNQIFNFKVSVEKNGILVASDLEKE